MKIKNKFNLLLLSSLLVSGSSFATDISENYTAEISTISKDLHEEADVIQHLLEATEKNVNPVILAIQTNNFELAELLFMIRRIELALGIETFDFPGYKFKRPYGDNDEHAIVWVKQSPVTLLSENGRERYFSEAKIDLDVLKLLVKNDEQKLWVHEISDILKHAYQRCDLEGILFCLQLSSDYPDLDLEDSISKPRYLVDPFLFDFPIDLRNPTHFYNNSEWHNSIPCIWDYRPDDNVIIRELKKQIQNIVPQQNQEDTYQQQINDIQNELHNLVNQVQANKDECKQIFDQYKTEISTLKNEIATLEAQRKQNTEEYRKKIEELENKLRESQEIELALIKYGNNPDGMSTLHYAIKQGDVKTLNVLIAAGADTNSRDHGVTALIRAVLNNQLEIAKLLLANGADVNDVVKLNTGADGGDGSEIGIRKTDALYFAAKSGSFDMINLLIKNNAKIENNYGGEIPNIQSPLHLASRFGNFDAVKALVTCGADINGKSANDKNRPFYFLYPTPLDFAASNLKYSDNSNNLELVKYLVQNGAHRKDRNYDRMPCPVLRGYLQSIGE